jgi:predicted O-linked N-acetylglucosamine transferase (SPINDLY family)
MGRPDEAAQCYREALRINPRHRAAHLHLAKAQERLGRLDEAEQSYRAALALDPGAVEPLIDLGNLLRKQLRYAEAEASYRQALALRADRAVIHYNLGTLLSSIDRQEEAESAYRQAIAIDPEFGSARWALAMAHPPLIPGTCEEAARSRAAFAGELDALVEWFTANPSHDARALVAHPFRLAYQEDDNRELLARYGQLSAGLMGRWLEGQPERPARRARTGAIRLGVVSAHVYQQSVWSAIVKGWLQCFDRSRFELDVFYLGDQRDDETAFAESQAAHFEPGPRTLNEWVQAIAQRQPDVLIYPEIGMDATTASLASLRLAPVQAAAWGHPETTGLPTLDYYLSAELLEPPDAQAHYTERLVALPNLGCFLAAPSVAPIAPDYAALGIDAGSPVLICAGTPFKYSPCHDWVLPAIAKALERCQFVFFTNRVKPLSEKLRRRLAGVFEREGLDFDRYVRFVPWQSPPAFYGLMQRADLMLDTIGFSGFNTALQAVECGLPIVTREGRFMRGRLASGILKRLGLPELVAASENEYVALAVKLARESGYRAEVRARIEAARPVLYEDRAPIRALEAFLASVAGR